MSHPSFGPLTPEEFKRAAALPAGAAAAVIRRHDPLWGLVAGDAVIKKYKVSVSRAVSSRITASVEVEADNEANAEKIVRAMSSHTFDWQDPDDWDNDGSIEIDDVEEA